MRKNEAFARMVKALRRRFPTLRRVIVRKIDMRIAGSSSWSGKKFTICVNKKHAWRTQRDTLIHEWAHVLTWFADVKDDHSCIWGAKYSEIYRSFIHKDPIEPLLRTT